MSSIFNTLNIGYSGLNVAQVAVSTTSQNISNAGTEGYSRQRTVTSVAQPLSTEPGNVGNGAKIEDIKRIFDNFVYDRYRSLSGDNEYADFSEKTLNELSTYFPEIDQVGIKSDLSKYFNMWQTYADNPDNDAIKLALSEQAIAVTKNIKYTQAKIVALQSRVNEQLLVNVNKVNELTSQLAAVNHSIAIAESGGGYTANDLRDKRNILERNIIRLVGGKVNTQTLTSNIEVDPSSNTTSGSYTLNVNGFNLVDGQASHKIHIDNAKNPNKFYELSYERQDGKLIPMDENISGGTIGAILTLRGKTGLRQGDGAPTDGILQNIVTQMNAFAKGFIENTNNLYAQGATDRMTSNSLDINPTNSVVNSGLNIKTGSFDIVVYDIDGKAVAKRKINIDASTTMNIVSGGNSIEYQVGASIDDNGDGNANDNINNYIQYNWATDAGGNNAVEFAMNPSQAASGYTFAIVDQSDTTDFAGGTNFAGALGLHRFFDGKDATDITLHSAFKTNPTLISGGKAPISGDNTLALDMVEQQSEKYDFEVGNITYNTSLYGMFDTLATDVGTKTSSAVSHKEAVLAQFNATKLEYSGISNVSTDEEMTNLIRYQTSYAASAKLISTIDKMMQTLLGIKQ